MQTYKFYLSFETKALLIINVHDTELILRQLRINCKMKYTLSAKVKKKQENGPFRWKDIPSSFRNIISNIVLCFDWNAMDSAAFEAETAFQKPYKTGFLSEHYKHFVFRLPSSYIERNNILEKFWKLCHLALDYVI